MLQDAAGGQPTHQLVSDVHVAEGLCQDGTGLLHAPVRGRVQRGPAVMILDIELIASLNQKPEENPNKTFRSSASGFSAQPTVICLMLQILAPTPGLASQASAQLSQVSPPPPKGHIGLQPHHPPAQRSPRAPSPHPLPCPTPALRVVCHLPPQECLQGLPLRLRGTWRPA